MKERKRLNVWTVGAMVTPFTNKQAKHFERRSSGG
jgi:hypothetical protein